MKLSNIYKYLFLLLLFAPFSAVRAQQVWSLEQCIETALEHNKNLQVGRNNIALSELREKEAKANLIPKITANGEYQYFIELPHQLMPMSTFNPMAPEGEFIAAQFGVPHNIGANLQMTIPLYSPDLYAGIKSTGIAIEVSKLQQKRSEEEVYFEVSNLYYNAQILLHQLAFIDSNLVNTEKLHENMKLKKEQLLARSTDVDKVRLQLDQLETQRENLQNAYWQVLDGLKLMMGVDLNMSLNVENEIDFNNETEYEVQNSMDYRLLEMKNKLLEHELGNLTKSRFLPSAGLVASYGTNGFGYDKSPHRFLDFYSIGFAGVSVSYPLFSGTIKKKQAESKRIELANNQLQMELVNESTKMQIAGAERNRVVSLKSVTDTGKQAALAGSIYDQTLLQQKQSTASLTEVLLADNAMREAQQNYISAVVDYLKADLELKKLTGNILSNGYYHNEE